MKNQNEIQQLIERSRRKDATAFSGLVGEYQMFVFRLAFRLMCDEDEAKDMVQETFVKVWLSLDKYQENYRFSTWIYKIACNVCYDRMRSLRHSPSNYPSGSDCMELNLSSGDDAEAALVNAQLKELILRFTDELTPKQKLVFTLSDVEELPVSEIETITGLSAEKIKSNLFLARKNIRNRMNKIDAEL